jgi:putative endonuclease
MRDAATLVFVEVRFRRNANFGGAAVSIDAGKRRKIARAAQAWLSSHKQYSTVACRFDVVAMATTGSGLDCQWIRSAFTLDDLW